MSETESKHDNRSAFGDEITDPHAFVRNHPIAPVFSIGVNSSTGVDPLWSQTIHQCTARALTAALADALGIELHPAGTAERIATVDRDQASAKAMWAKACERDKAARAIIEANLRPATPVLDVSGIPELQAQRNRLLPPRRLRVPPVYRDTPTDVLECLYHTLCRRTYPSEVRNKASDIMYERDLMDHYTGDLTDDGWGDLTAIEHPEGREHVEPDEHEKPAEPHPPWSEPIEQMSPERCYHVARALGFHVEVRSTFDGADRTYWAFISEWNGLDQEDGARMTTELEAWQSAVVMAARKRDRYDAETDRVDLTGLEVLAQGGGDGD